MLETEGKKAKLFGFVNAISLLEIVTFPGRSFSRAENWNFLYPLCSISGKNGSWSFSCNLSEKWPFSLEPKYHHNQYVKLFFTRLDWHSFSHNIHHKHKKKWWIFSTLKIPNWKRKPITDRIKELGVIDQSEQRQVIFDVFMLLKFFTRKFYSISKAFRKLVSVIMIRKVFIYVFLRKLFFSRAANRTCFSIFVCVPFAF